MKTREQLQVSPEEEIIREEEKFRKEREGMYREVPAALDEAVLSYSRKQLAQKRFVFRFPVKLRAVAAILILALPITAVFLMESGGELPGNKELAGTVKKAVKTNGSIASRMDMADMELYQLNNDLDLVQNLLAYSSGDKQSEKINF